MFKTMKFYSELDVFSFLFNLSLYIGIHCDTRHRSYTAVPGDFDTLATSHTAIRSLSKCATKCTETAECVGFLYNPVLKGCQLAFTVLTPTGSSSNPAWRFYVRGWYFF